MGHVLVEVGCRLLLRVLFFPRHLTPLNPPGPSSGLSEECSTTSSQLLEVPSRARGRAQCRSRSSSPTSRRMFSGARKRSWRLSPETCRHLRERAGQEEHREGEKDTDEACCGPPLKRAHTPGFSLFFSLFFSRGNTHPPTATHYLRTQPLSGGPTASPCSVLHPPENKPLECAHKQQPCSAVVVLC